LTQTAKKGETMEEKKQENQEQPVIISYRRRCRSDSVGTGLSHYIMMEENEDNEEVRFG
jgi:modified peptide precursor CbpA